MKKAACTIVTLFIISGLYSQCSLRPVSLTEKITNATLVVEGKVISQNSFWDNGNKMIYTASKIEVYRIFKGSINGNYIEVITMGGAVGNDLIKAEPELELELNDIGLFSCIPSNAKIPFAFTSAIPQLDVYASAQGFIKYNLAEQSASVAFADFLSIVNDLYPAVKSLTGVSVQALNNISFLPSSTPSTQAAPSVTGISPLISTAGTKSVLTITGTGFGATQGSGTVGFKNGDDGGATYINPLASEYLSWTDTQIKLEIPSSAGSGNIKVTQGTSVVSTKTLSITYSHINSKTTSGTIIAYPRYLVNIDGSGGYTWQMYTGFDSNAPAKASFIRAFDTWRCASGVNWKIGSTTSVNSTGKDGTNVIRFDIASELPSGIIARCYSYYSSCTSGGVVSYVISEMDIVFDSGTNFQFGPSAPASSQSDFESFAVHELGHGHQLGHVIKKGDVMHYMLSNGTMVRSLSSDDLSGGNYLQAKNIAAGHCSYGAMINYTGCGSATTTTTPPIAAFTVIAAFACTGNSISFTDKSSGTPTSWSWSFQGGTPAVSNVQNPVVVYNTAGIYGVTLTATNAGGSNTIKKTGFIKISDAPTLGNTSANVSCNGGGNGSISITATGGISPYKFKWSNNKTTASLVNLTQGVYTCTVTDLNGCIAKKSVTISQPSALVVTVTSAGSTATANATGGTSPYTYLWNNGKNTKTVSNLANGSYTVTVTDANGCTNKAKNSIALGIQMADNVFSAELFPNPNNGSFHLYLTMNENTMVQISVCNILGEQTEQRKINASAQITHQLEFENYTQGIYFVSIFQNNFRKTFKVVVE